MVGEFFHISLCGKISNNSIELIICERKNVVNIINIIKKIISAPKRIIVNAINKGYLNWISDSFYLRILYRLYFHKKLNLDNPKTYNEKLQWLKLYDRKPEYTQMVDKYAVREYIKKQIGEEYLIPLIGVWDTFNDINKSMLPKQFVLKTTHDSGGVVICLDKETFDWDFAEKKLNKSLNKNYYNFSKEWPYKNVKPKIIAEKYMIDESGYELKDYKFFCFNGSPEVMFIATDRMTSTKFDYFDMEFNRLPLKQHYENNKKRDFVKPDSFEKMIELAQYLSRNIPHVRVDFYDINGQIYFGELTFYHFSGFVKFEPEKYDLIFGEYIELPKQKISEKD